VPTTAINFQTILSIAFAVLFFLLFPLIPIGIKTTDLVVQVYFVGVGSATVLWALATVFLFVNVLYFVRNTPEQVKQARLFSIPVLVVSSVIGTVSGIVATIDTIFNSWTPLIDNGHWWILVIGLTAIVLIIGVVASMTTTIESGWQSLQLVQSYSSEEAALSDALSATNPQDERP
jgi:hypothetical protein